MAQDENPIETGPNAKRRTADLLPRYFRTTANKKFLSSTLDQMMQPGVVEKVDGFIGRRDAKAWKASDNYVADVSNDREAYQLEPVATVTDDLGNITFYKDYRDYVNSCKIRNADVVDHSKLSSQEYYAWDPHISWDKFVNFREYYWLPTGPTSIPVYGSSREIQSTFNVTKQNNTDNDSYLFSDEVAVSNPTLTLYRGQSYIFDVDAADMPFTIRTSANNSSDGNIYTKGITNQNIDSGKIVWDIDLETPDTLYYVNSNDIEATGLIVIKDIRDNTFIDVAQDILDKKTYKMQNGYELSNGMKLEFFGNVTPEKYGKGKWYVEGVGKSIKLISEEDLVISASYLSDVATKFDANDFDALPFDDAISYSNQKDYIVINKASKDRNQWSRNNLWTHKSVIETTAKINDVEVSIDQNFRATRPIIEFESGLKLYNFGTEAKQSVDLIDTVTKDVFSEIEGQAGYFVDGIELVSGMRVLFTADPDSFVAGKIYEVNFITQNNVRQIALKETTDTTPLTNETILVTAGTKNKGKIFWYNGTNWLAGQDKTQTNQAPLFDLYTDGNTELSGLASSTFRGCKVFSYKVGTGIADTELGFALSYRTIENSGDITFDFNLLGDTYQYESLTDVVTVSTDTALLRRYRSREVFDSVSGWTTANTKSIQPVVKQITTGPRTNNFIIDQYRNSGDLNDLTCKVYVDNDRKYANVDYEIDRINNYAYIRFYKDLAEDQKVVLKTTSSAPKNNIGYYEFPVNFEKNPMNENITSFTLGEVSDHVDSIVDNEPSFAGVFPGVSNLRDLGDVSKFGLKFVQHSGPINLAIVNLTDKDYNMVEAIKFAGEEYIKFKREFLRTANDLGFESFDKAHVDKVLLTMMNDKTSSDPFYFSDMVPFGGDTVQEIEIEDSSQTIFALTRTINFEELNEKAVLIYLDDQQLIKDKDYTISTDGFMQLIKKVVGGEKLKIYEFETTDGCWIPPTPTKLGLYPKFEPQIYSDDTYISDAADSAGPFKIYGIDEETTKGYKNKLGWFYPVFTEEVAAQGYDKQQGGTGLAHTHKFKGDNRVFYMPNTSMSHATFDTNDFPEWPSNRAVIQGHDGSIWRCFGDFRDKLLLDLEKRIYNNLKQEYAENIVDIADFVPSKTRGTDISRYQIAKTITPEFARWLETVGNPDYVENSYFKRGNSFTYNYSLTYGPDNISLSGFWRSIYKDVYNTDRPHSHPWECLGIKIKPTWFETTYGKAPYTSNNLLLWEDLSKGIVREPNKKIVYRNKFKNPEIYNYIPVDKNGNLLSPLDTGYARGGIDSAYSDDFKFGDESPVETAWRRSSNYPFALMKSWAISKPAQIFGLAWDRSRIVRNAANQLVYKDTSKRIELKQIKFPNSAADDNRINTAGFVNYMQGYLAQNETVRFKDYKEKVFWLENKIGSKIAGFSQKDKFKLILDSRTPLNEGNIFVPEENYQLTLVSGVPTAVYSYSGVIVEKLPRGFKISGYDKSNPNFTIFNPIKRGSDQVVNVGGVSETFLTFDTNRLYELGQIVDFNGTYYRVKVGHTSGNTFDQDNFQKLAELPVEGGANATFAVNFEEFPTNIPYGTVYTEIQDVVDFLLGYGKHLEFLGFTYNTFNKDLEEIENWRLSCKEFMFWTTQNWGEGAVLTVSPSARQIEFFKDYHVVDDIYNTYYDYSLLKADGKRLLADFATTERDNTNAFGLYVKNTQEGIYHLKIPVIQTEHAVVLDNETVFGDKIYNRAQGYRQERIRVKGYRSDGWNGSLNVPGFIFDDAKIEEWVAWQDYSIGTLVKYKQYFYVAKNRVVGNSTFQDKDFVILNDKPVPRLLANFDYKAKQFADFYDLDSDNFDVEQQKLAQHLIGYQKRRYLENIIPDDVSQYKFFQGMIQDKGTKNSLTKLFDKLGSANKDSLEFYEEWAIRLGRYGATTGNDVFEVLLDEDQYRLEPQTVELVDFVNPQDTSLIYRLDRNNVYVKSQNYNHKPLPVKYYNDDNMFVPSAGYVNPADISTSLANYNDIVNQDISALLVGSYVWTAKEKNQLTWGVYRYVSSTYQIESISEATDTSFAVTVSEFTDFSVGDIIGLNDIDDATNGFYKITNIELNKLTCETSEVIQDTTEDYNGKGFVTRFRSSRVSQLADANQTIIDTGRTIPFSLTGDNVQTETVWVDDDDTGKWTVLRAKQVYELKEDIINKSAGIIDSTEKDFGASVSVSDNNNLIAITAPKDLNGSVYVFNRPSDNVEPNLLQQIDEATNLFDTNGGFGTSASLSPDGKYLAIGSPNASNVKSKSRGDYDPLQTYASGDIVLYSDQLWRAKRIVEAQAVQTFENFSSNQQSKIDEYNSSTSLYPDVVYMMRGNYSMPGDATDHILIRAEKEQYEGTKPGDILTLAWNRYTSSNPAGIAPFNNDPVLNEAFINGQHTIVGKVDRVIEVISALATPDVADELITNTARCTVQYRYINNDNKLILYLNNINGELTDTGNIFKGNILLGTYTTINKVDDNYHAGWWYVNVGTNFNSNNLEEINANLVVRNITLENDVVVNPDYTNILDAKQNQDIATEPTRASYYSVLSHTQGGTEVSVLDSRWIVRTEATAGASVQVGDNFRLWVNEIYVSGNRQDPSAINLSYDYLNDTNHTVNDIWNGWTDVRITNFDNAGNPFLPIVGDTVTCVATGATGEVAFIKRDFAVVRLFLKNKTGTWSKGSDFNEPSDVTFVENDSTVRTIGPINSTHVENSVSGPLLVVDKAETIPIPSTMFIQDTEYWIYTSNTLSGITDTANPPGPINLDWTRVYNIPALASGYKTGNTNEGIFAIYEKRGNTYLQVNYYTVPNSASGRKLGHQVKLRQTGTDSYKLFVHAKGDGTGFNDGRIYIFDKDSNNDWAIATDNNYRGFYKTSAVYFENDLVRVGDTIYKAKTNLLAGPFDITQWTTVSSGVDLIGYLPNDTSFSLTDSVLEQNDLEEFGENFDVSKDASVVIATAKYINRSDSSLPTRKVVVYRKNQNHYEYSQILEPFNTTENFGSTIAISNDGKKIAIGAPFNSDITPNGGAVYIYTQNGSTYSFSQTIRPVDTTPNTRFGFNLDFDGNTLAITSKGGDLATNTTFDQNSTKFDAGSTPFRVIDNDSGLVSVYETINDTLLYGQDFAYDEDTQEFGSIITVKDNHVYLGLPKQAVQINNKTDRGMVAEYRKPSGTTTWNVLRNPVLPVDTNKLKGVYLFNKTDNNLVGYVDYIDPLQGKIAGPANQEISFKTSYDPAKYSISTVSGLNANPLDYTSDKWVGKIWWDIGSAQFINHHQGDITESTQNFNKLFTGTTVDVYEWVESTLLPSEWDTQSGTEAGLANGISGTSKYGDSAYSLRRKYNTASQTFTNFYYYWVLNKLTVPNMESRTISAFDIGNYISDPASQQYRFVAPLGADRFALYNCKNLVKGKDVGISWNWWTIENQEQNTHNQYQLISDGLATSQPHPDIEQKWFDSLIGFDSNERPVPDIDLPLRQKYGNLNEPRQSWFVNRTEARKQFVERVNDVLSKELVVDEKDLSGLTAIDPLPTVATGKFDTTSDSFAEIRFVSVARVKRARLTLEIENGNIINVLIPEPGAGYINPPTYVISDANGSGGELKLILDANGGITRVDILSPGQNYSTNASITIREFSVLVKNDETVGGKWAVFAWDGTEYLRTQTQSFDVNNYWEYVDWYATGYSKFTTINYQILGSYQLPSLEDSIGDVIKIQNVGTGGWLLLKKKDDQVGVDYTVNYDTIGRQSGTIKFKAGLYDSSSENIAYDGASFDKIFYDTEPIEEFRRILGILKDKILTNDLQIHWNNLFFASLRYVFTEQPNVDWAFKTSYIKAKHNIGELKQKVNFQNDNLSSYEDYVKEVKPYKTKIREYLSSYEKIDPSSSVVTDFDLPPVYNADAGKIIPQSVQIIDNKVQSGTTDVQRYPSKHWIDNLGFELTSFTIADAGSGYTDIPKIKITGGGGSGAEAQAYIGNGKVTSVVVTKPGSGYLSQPTISIEGSLEDGGTPARLSPILGRGKARSLHVRCKFDRVTGTYLFSQLNETQTFTSTLDQQIFNLKWPMQLKSTQIKVTVDGLESLRSEYTFTNKTDTSKGYTRSFGRITFTNPLALGKSVIISYEKAPDLLQAQDRINLYYNPTTGMFGNDLGQLLDGIDYGGVEVSSYSFGAGTGWDSDGWFTTTYDTFDTTFDDEIFQMDGSTEVFNLSQPLANGIVYNVYLNGVRIDDPNYGTASQTNANAVMSSITGDGTTTTVTITNDIQSFKANDVVVFRKTTSDGAFLPDPRSYDTILSGGDLQFSTAKGVNAEEIIIDGDGFVTPTTSKGPEEQVPGQVLDTVDIKVFHRPGAGGSVLSSNSYNADGNTFEFEYGITPQNKEGLFVRLDDIIQNQNTYTVDYRLKKVKFRSAPGAGTSVNILSISGNGENIIEFDEFIADGSTVQYVTKARYTPDVDYYATVDGVAVESVLIPSTDSTDEDAKCVILFGSPPRDQGLINFAVYSKVDSFSKIETQEFVGDGSTKVFTLTKTPYSSKPNSHNVIVKQGDKILNPGYNQQFTVTAGVREYFLEIWQTPIGSFDNSDVLVLLNGNELKIATEYNIRPANSSVILEPGIGNIGDILEVYIRTDGEYAFGSIQVVNNQNTWVDSGADLQLSVAPGLGEKITVYTFNKHDIQNIERINYDLVARSTLIVGSEDHIQYNHLRAGLIKLRYPAIDAQFVWLTINGILKTPSVDYFLTDDKKFIKYDGILNDNDVVELIQFSSQGPTEIKFGFSQFKDILNRNIYKRLGDVASMKLVKDFLITDKEIHIDDASSISAPDKTSKIPGILFINGERVEFLIKQGNVLKQIQRATLGTGAPLVHKAGSDVLNQGIQQTAPYVDSTIVENFIGDNSTSVFELGFTPASVNEFEVFVAGKRLRKNAIQVFDPTIDQDSPEADITAPAEFSVTGTTPYVTLLNTPVNNAKIQVIRRQGKRWADPGVSLNDAESLVARFFKAEKVELPK